MSISDLARKLKWEDLFMISFRLKTETDENKRADFERALANGEAYNAALACRKNNVAAVRALGRVLAARW